MARQRSRDHGDTVQVDQVNGGGSIRKFMKQHNASAAAGELTHMDRVSSSVGNYNAEDQSSSVSLRTPPIGRAVVANLVDLDLLNELSERPLFRLYQNTGFYHIQENEMNPVVADLGRRGSMDNSIIIKAISNRLSTLGALDEAQNSRLARMALPLNMIIGKVHVVDTGQGPTDEEFSAHLVADLRNDPASEHDDIDFVQLEQLLVAHCVGNFPNKIKGNQPARLPLGAVAPVTDSNWNHMQYAMHKLNRSLLATSVVLEPTSELPSLAFEN